MLKTHAVGIDLGTTYSCISYLNEHGEPVTLANQEGELATPSVVLFDEAGEVIVGTEALRNAVVKPARVVQNAKRHMGDSTKRWNIDGRSYTPVDIATLVLKKLLAAAREQIGGIEQAVITVPAQFSDVQRQWVMEAGRRAGLKRADIINEPVAAALCYVLGTEGLWFTELAEEQRILVYDLGGGTFDLSLVKYHKNEVKVIASSGDLSLGGIDWNRTLLDAIAKQFDREFKVDPRSDPESLQFLAIEVENTKRSLTVRPKAALTCQHEGHRKSYQVEQTQFEQLTRPLVSRTCDITQSMLRDNNMGWAHVDVILTVGGASRMPMVRNALKQLGGRTLNTSLSPDQSIAHGATYYAGMLLTNSDFARSILSEEVSARLASIKQQSVNARGLGILVRDENDNRVPFYQIPANTPLPTSVSQEFGTVIPNQKRVNLRIVESGTDADEQYVELGMCVIDDLPPNLPENSQIEVTISYDEQARVHVSARDVTSGKEASTEIVREESVIQRDSAEPSGSGIPPAAPEVTDWQSSEIKAAVSGQAEGQTGPGSVSEAHTSQAHTSQAGKSQAGKAGARGKAAAKSSGTASTGATAPADHESKSRGSEDPVPLCNDCGAKLNERGRCPECTPASDRKVSARKEETPAPSEKAKTQKARVQQPAKQSGASTSKKAPRKADAGNESRGTKSESRTPAAPKSGPAIPVDDDEILELDFADDSRPKAAPRPQPRRKVKPKKAKNDSPSVKAPPLPPALSGNKSQSAKPSESGGIQKGGLADEGEDEFWQLVDD